MKQNYGMSRVLEPQHVLPTLAWRLDNSRELSYGEMRIALRTIHIEGTSFKQICLEAGDSDARIRQRILDIVIRRGKLHNPVTDTGGLFCGTVSGIAEGFDNKKGFREGDEVICNASLASVPIYIDRIVSIDRAFGQIDAEGYAIVYNDIPVIRRPAGLPVNLLLFTFNESGTLYRVSNAAVGRKKFLVVGNNLLSNLLFGYAVKKVAREGAEIVCLLDKRADMVLRGKSIDRLISRIFTEVYYVDILKPMECMEWLKADSLFDLSVNCANIPGAETINILAAKSGGTVVFANLINNYNIALYITESVSKQLDIRCAEGYLEDYDEFDIEIVKDLIPYIVNAEKTNPDAGDGQSFVLGGSGGRSLSLDGGAEDRAQDMQKPMLEDFVCESSAMKRLMGEILTVSKYDCNVLITGNTGVGKEEIANIIYKNSSRKIHPFIKVNCASLAPSQIEFEFFGHERHGFAKGDADIGIKKGYFELADNGVIFLDEISELLPDMQAKLLRVIRDGEFFRVGGSSPIKTNVRIISAADGDLEELMDGKKFHRALYYGLNVIQIKVPDLSERIADIPALIGHFLKKYGDKFHIRRGMDSDAVEYMKQLEWPGNIRELENVVQRLMISAKGEQITLFDVMREIRGDMFGESPSDNIALRGGGEIDLGKAVRDFERGIIKRACEGYGSTRKAAKAIGVSQTQLVRKKKKYGL